ncbi:DnaJ family domain-containing protein [Rathayibacter sp. CAU 1779]
MTEDPRLAAARRRLEKAAGASRGDPEDAAELGPGAGGPADLQRAAMVEVAIQQAIRRGEFDDLPGAGKPLPGLGRALDEDWWIRRKIETEQLRGLGPPALTLRVENAELDDRLDALWREAEVRETLEDFNRRVIEARRQLLGGPPVVTPTRDVDAEVDAWRQRRAEREAAAREAAAYEKRAAEEAQRARRRRWFRRDSP